jgi:DHA2 family multidrug resistance protein
MSQHITLGMDFGTAFTLRILQTLGLAFIFIPSSTLNYVGIPREKSNQISAINSFVRNVGGSLGIALITNFLTRSAQRHQNYLVEHAVPGSPAYTQMLNGITSALKGAGVQEHGAQQQALGRVYGMVQEHATTLAYVDAIQTLAILIFAVAPLILILRRPPKHAAPAVH